jgi:hypothetical protein
MLSAVYRLVAQGWTKDAAIEEMKEGGHGFNPLWNNLVRWVDNSDIESLRNEVGISTLPKADSAWAPSQSRLLGAPSSRITQ